MFPAILALFTGPFGAIITKVLIGLAVSAGIVAVYFTIRHNAASEQRLKDQAIILQQLVDNQNKFIIKMNENFEASQKAQRELTDTITVIQDSTGKINDYLNQPELAKEDRPASNILKETIKRLSGEK